MARNNDLRKLATKVKPASVADPASPLEEEPKLVPVRVSWTETASYERVFLLPDDLDLDDMSVVHEALEDMSAWDHVDWLKDLVEVSDRVIDDAVAEPKPKAG